MNGAQIIIKTAVTAGIDICFANPGTTEMPLVAALAAEPAIQSRLGLFEGCCTGAADGYGRMTGRPALTLLHLGPGLANGIANLHNAHRAGTPVVNLVGDHASWHLAADAPLTMDIQTLAGTIPGWHRMATSVDSLSRDTADAICAALAGQVATLIIPQDFQWGTCTDTTICTPSPGPLSEAEDRVHTAAALLDSTEKAVIIMGGQALKKDGLLAAARIREKTGCALFSSTFPPCMEQGIGWPVINRVPYFPKQAVKQLADYSVVILAGMDAPVAFFGYQGMASQILADHQTVFRLDSDSGDVQQHLSQLADHINAPAYTPDVDTPLSKPAPVDIQASLSLQSLGQILCADLPDNAIVVDESITSGAAYSALAPSARPHTLMTLTGGALGMGMPCAVGAALACPDRPVINLQADGAGMYAVQSLWMQARDGLNITTLICANRRYHILSVELARAGYTTEAAAASPLMQLDNPVLDWVSISQGMGVPAVSVRTGEQLHAALTKAQTDPGPHLIEMVL